MGHWFKLNLWKPENSKLWEEGFFLIFLESFTCLKINTFGAIFGNFVKVRVLMVKLRGLTSNNFDYIGLSLKGQKQGSNKFSQNCLRISVRFSFLFQRVTWSEKAKNRATLSSGSSEEAQRRPNNRWWVSIQGQANSSFFKLGFNLLDLHGENSKIFSKLFFAV